MVSSSSHLFLSHSPQCQQYRESTSVLENQPAGTFVLQVHAVDADEGSNGRVTYGFMHKDSTVPAFSIHPETGNKTYQHLNIKYHLITNHKSHTDLSVALFLNNEAPLGESC